MWQAPSYRSGSDEELARRARAGVEGAFAVLLTRYQKPLYQLVRRTARDSEYAEEVTHTILTRAYRELDTFGDEASFREWISAIAAREIAARGRSMSRVAVRRGARRTTSDDLRYELPFALSA
jgi:RNA polymerase sigma-70 factor (ECF subfamily)